MRSKAGIVLVALCAVGLGVLGADSPDAQSLTIGFTKTALGDIGIMFDWDYCNSKLVSGPAWVIIQNKIHVKSTIHKTSAWGGHITSDEPWMVDEDPNLVRAIICGYGVGTLYLKVKDAYGNKHMWSVPFGEIQVQQGRLYYSLKRQLCAVLPAWRNPYSYAEIPGTAPIGNIDAFLATCPPEDELAILEADFPVLFEPAMRTKDPEYTCHEPISRMRILSDQLAIYQALRVIRHMKLSEPLPWTSLHPYEWLKSKIGAIVVSYMAEHASCCHVVYPPGKPEGVLAITIPKADQNLLRSRMVWRDPQSGVGLADLILLIFHEARHVDLPHDCGTKDSSLDYKGAWAVQYYMAEMMAEGKIDVGLAGTNYPQYLAALAAEILATRFCNE